MTAILTSFVLIFNCKLLAKDRKNICNLEIEMTTFFRRTLLEIPKAILNMPVEKAITSKHALDMCALYLSDQRLNIFNWQMYYDRFPIRSLWPMLVKDWSDSSTLLLLYSHLDDYHAFPFEFLRKVKPINLMMGHALLVALSHSRQMSLSLQTKSVNIKTVLHMLISCGIPLTEVTIQLAFEALVRKVGYTTRLAENQNILNLIEEISMIQRRSGVPNSHQIDIAKLKVLGSNKAYNEMFAHFEIMETKDQLAYIYLYRYSRMSLESAKQCAGKYLDAIFSFIKPSKDLFYQAFRVAKESDSIDYIPKLLDAYTSQYEITPRLYDLLIGMLMVQYGKLDSVETLMNDMQAQNINFSNTTYYHLMTYHSSVDPNSRDLNSLITMMKERDHSELPLEESNLDQIYTSTKANLQSGFSVSSFYEFLKFRRDFPNQSVDLENLIPSEYIHMIPPPPHLRNPNLVAFDSSNAIYDANSPLNSIRRNIKWDLNGKEENLFISTENFVNDNTPATILSKKDSKHTSDTSYVEFDGRMCLKVLRCLAQENRLPGALYYWSRILSGLKTSIGGYYVSRYESYDTNYDPLKNLLISTKSIYKDDEKLELKEKYLKYVPYCDKNVTKSPLTAFYPRPSGLHYPVTGSIYLPSDLVKATVLIIDYIHRYEVMSDFQYPELDTSAFLKPDVFKNRKIDNWLGKPVYLDIIYSSLDEFSALCKENHKFTRIPNIEEYESVPTIQDPVLLGLLCRRLFLDTIAITVDTFDQPKDIAHFSWFKDLCYRLSIPSIQFERKSRRNNNYILREGDYGSLGLTGDVNSMLKSILPKDNGIFDKGAPDFDKDAYTHHSSQTAHNTAQ
eukprot:NODE_91_length_21557_cov_0.766660.p2 type:complete len:846 gc:universal NODE_91_length_21557_cov_0.766660:16285-18822(+)